MHTRAFLRTAGIALACLAVAAGTGGAPLRAADCTRYHDELTGIAELGKTHAEFVTYLSGLFPKVAIASTSVASLGGGLYRVKAEIENAGFLPTATAQAVRSRSVKPTMVQLGVDPADIVSGAPKTSFFPTLAGSGRRQAYEWIIKGRPGATIVVKAVAEKGGVATASLTLK